MNPADLPRPGWEPQPAMIAAVHGLRLQLLNEHRQHVEGLAGGDDNDSEEEETDNYEEVMLGFLRTVADKERTKSKTKFAEYLSRKQNSEKYRQISACRLQKLHEKMAPMLLIECISALFNDAKLSDVTLKVGPHLFHAHKLILCAWSEVFRSLTDRRWVPCSSGTIDEPQVHTLNEPEECQECFKDFLRFMYTEKVELMEGNVYPILTLADKYLVHDLRDVCEEYLLVMLESSTRPWIDAMKAIRLTEGLTRVQAKSFSLLENNFHSWSSEDDMMLCRISLDISNDLLVRLLESSNLVVPNETFVFDTVIRWLSDKNCHVEREESTEQMLALVRFEHIPAADLASLVNHRPPTLQPRLKENVFEALKARALAGEESFFDMQQEFTDPRVYMEPMFCVRITNSECRIEGEPPFKELSLFTNDTDAEFKKHKLSFPVARESEEQNIYLINQDVWEIGGFSEKQDTGEKWNVRYIVRPHFEDIGRSYRMAVLTHETGIEEEQLEPITCVNRGDVGREITIDIPSTALDCDCNPEKVVDRSCHLCFRL